MNLTINLEERILDKTKELLGFSKFEDIRSIKIECETTHNELMWSVKLLLFIGDKHIKQIITIDKLDYETATNIVSGLSMLIYGYKPALIDLHSGISDLDTKPIALQENNMPLTIQNDITKITIGYKGKYITMFKPTDLSVLSLIGTEGKYSLVDDWECVFDSLSVGIKKFCTAIYKITPVIEKRITSIIERAEKYEEYSIVFKYGEENENEFLKALEKFVKFKMNVFSTIKIENEKTFKDSEDNKMVVILGLVQLVSDK